MDNLSVKIVNCLSLPANMRKKLYGCLNRTLRLSLRQFRKVYLKMKCTFSP